MNKEKRKKIIDKNYRENNKEKIRLKARKYYLKNKKEFKQYRQEHREEIKKYARQYYLKNKEKSRQYAKDNRNKINKYTTKYIIGRKLLDKEFRLLRLLRDRFLRALKYYTKTGKILKARDYEIDYQSIIDYLQPLPENLSDYHIHHIKPLFTFNFVNDDGSTNLEEIKKAFAPKNHSSI